MSSAITFQTHARDGRARTGTIATPHGDIATPAFLPVGTAATVKTLSIADLKEIGAPAVLSNTYHLMLRPGAELVARHGGLHGFMGWDGPTITDSGGFQVFSLGFGLEHGVSKISSIFPDEDIDLSRRIGKQKLMTVDEEGVSFRSHLDGTQHRITAESSIATQQLLGADLILAFDECTSPLHDATYTRQAMERTHRWAQRSLDAWTNREHQALYGIVQGGAYQDSRTESAQVIDAMEFPGLAIGGSLGRSKQDMHDILDWTEPLLDPAKPRHLLGIGEVADLFQCSWRGMDTFDCVAPTRMARNGTVYLSPAAGGSIKNHYRLNIAAAKYKDDADPIDLRCQCSTCRTHSRAYIRHLFNTGEMLGPRLATIHNLSFVLSLMAEIRLAIGEQRLQRLASDWGVELG